MADLNAQSPASAVLMLDALAWVLEQLPERHDARDARARADTVRAVRDAASAAVDQHHDWTTDQLALARTFGHGEWERELLRALLGVEHAHRILSRTTGPTPEGDSHARLRAARCS